MAGGVIGNLMFAVGFKVADSALRRAQQETDGLEKSWNKVGIAAAGIAVAVGTVGKAAYDAASDFEKSMSNIQGATGMTAEQMEATKEVAKNLYSQNFGENWDDLGSAISAVQQVTGQTGSELEGTTRNALLLRDAFGYEVNESIKSVDTMMRQFGITSDQAYDLLAQGTQKGLNKSDELIDSANEYANQFAALGFSADEMFDVFAAGSAEGVFQLDKVGDAVKEFNIRAKDGSKASTEAFEALGLNADTMMHTFAKGGPQAKAAFSQVLQMISDIEDPVQKNQIGVALLGTQFEDLEASVVAGMGRATSQFKSTGDALAELNKVKFEKPGEAFQMFGRQLETGILIPIGEKILPYLTELGQWFADHKPQIEAFGAALGDKIGGAIDGIASAVQAALPTLQTIWDIIKDVATSFAQWDGALPTVVGLTTAFAAYKATLMAVNTAQKLQAMWAARAAVKQAALNFVMSLNPIGLVIAAIVGLVAAFVIAYKKSDKFREIVNKAWAGIKNAFSATMDFFTLTVPAVFNDIVTFIKTWGTNFLNIFINPFQTGVNLVKNKWGEIKNFAVTAFNGIVSFLKTWGPMFLIALTGPIGWTVALTIKYWDQIKTGTIAAFTAVKAWLVSVWNSIASAVSGAVNVVWSRIVSAWNTISAVNAAIFGGIRNFLSNTWNNIVNTVSTAATNIWNKITGIWNQITGFLKGINLFDIGRNIIEGMINGISSMANAVVERVKQIGDSITEKIKSILGIHSPSRVMMEVGFFTGEGLARGIEGTQDRVAAASAGVTEEIVPQASPAASPARALAPARVPGAGGAAGRMEISVNIDLRADASDANVASDVGAEVQRQVQAIVEQVFRRMGLPAPEVTV